MTITWKEELHGVGIPDIDEQHKQLFVLTNQVLEIRDMPPGPERQKKAVNIVKQVYAFTRYHFSTEEAIFAHYGFPEAQDHVRAHAGLTEKIRAEMPASHEASFNLGPLGDDLVDWILVHISRDDRKYAEYYRSQGITVDAHFSQGGATGAGTSVRQNARNLWYEKKMSLDISAIDRQHQELVLILQQANDLHLAAPDRRQVFLPTIIQKLKHYAEYHFLFEEELMSRYGYTGISDHQKLHQGYVKKIGDFGKELSADHSDPTDEIVVFLKQWIINHILVEDKAFKTQCQEALSKDQ